MNKITVRPESRRTEIRFSKELQADFDKLIKECLREMNLRLICAELQDCEKTIFYRIGYRLTNLQRRNIERKLCEKLGISYKDQVNEKRQERRKITKSLPAQNLTVFNGFKIDHDGDLITGYGVSYVRN